MWTKGFYNTAYSPTVPTHAQGNPGGFTPQTYEIHVALQDTYFKVKQMAVGSPPLPSPLPFFSLIENYSGAPARAKRARSGAPWVRKFGKLFIPENLVMT